jgi:hypothetical protein
MKKHFLKIVTLLIFASVAISSCSVQYRERQRSHHDHNNDRQDDQNHRN